MTNKLNWVRTWEDILLATPRTWGVIFNTANNLFNTLTNPVTRWVNYLNDRYRKSIERVTSRKFNMKEYTDILESDTFKQRLSKRWGNHKTRRVNKMRQTGNLWAKWVWVVKSALWTVPLAWNMTITNAWDALKDVWTTVWGAFHDVGKAVVAPADQWPDKQQFEYTKVQRDRLAWLKPVNNPTPTAKAEKEKPQPKKAEPAPEKPAPAPEKKDDEEKTPSAKNDPADSDESGKKKA